MDAIDDLGDAIEASRRFLTPVRPGPWLGLAVIVLFVSSLGFGGPSVPGVDLGTYPGELPMGEFEYEADEFSETEIFVGLVLVGSLLVIGWLVYVFVGSIMEFAFVESLRSEEVRVRRYARENLGNGARLFAFRVAVAVGFGLLGVVPLVGTVVLTGPTLPDASPGVALLSLLFTLTMGLLYAIVTRFTAEFVVAIMLLEDRGVLGAWRRFLTTLGNEWEEYGVYLVVIWILGFVARIVAWIAAGVGLFVLALVVGVPIWLAVTALGSAGVVVAAVLGVVGVLLALVLVALVWTPITVYFRYYALLLLGDTDPALDLLPDQRAAVRADSGWGGGGDWGGDDGGWRDDSGASDRDEGSSADDEFEWTDDPDRDDPDRDDDPGWQ